MLDDGVPDRVLAVYAHPDDPEVSCAGTLATWTDAGAQVTLVIATRGDKGAADPGVDPATLVATRAAETDAAAAVVGLDRIERLDIPDGDVTNDAALRERLVAVIRAVRPEVVVAPDPTALFFGSRYVNHRDHRELGAAVVDACAPAAGSPGYFPDAGPPHPVGALYLSGTLEPDTWVDITAVIDVKVRALQCHASQLGQDVSLADDVVRERARAAGAASGAGYAEAFRVIRLT